MRYAGQAFELPVPGPVRARPHRPASSASSAPTRSATATATPTARSSSSTSAWRWSCPGPEPRPVAAARPAGSSESSRPGALRWRVARDPGPARRARRRYRAPRARCVFELPEATLVLPPGWARRRSTTHGTIVATEVNMATDMTELRPDHAAGPGRRPARRLRRDGRDADPLRLLGQHQGAPRLLDRALRRRGELVMQAEHIPVHLGSMPDAVAAVLGEEQRAGDPPGSSTTPTAAAPTYPTSP